MKKLAIILLIILYVVPSFSQTMEWHIADEYVDVKYMGNALFKVKNSNGKWGVVNRYGEMTVAIQYDSITSIVENRALLLDITGQHLKGIINENGQIIKMFHNDERLANFPYFSEGTLAYGVIVGNYYLFGYLNAYGNTVIEPKYFWAAPFSNGKAVVQYKSKNYGIIDRTGGVALKDNRRFKFMSTPVDNRLLIAVSSSRGEKVLLVDLSSNGKFKEVEELEGGTIVKNGLDYKSISCLNGHYYYFDDAMRLVTSSTGKTFNEPLVYDYALTGRTDFKKVRDSNGWKVMHSGKTLFQTSFKDMSFCGNDYAIVTTQRNTKGVIRINDNGNISIESVPTQGEFYHNVAIKGNLTLNINGLSPSSQVQIGIVGLKENNQEEKYTVPVGYNGSYLQPVSYFIPATKYNVEVSIPVQINLYINGMLYKSEAKELTGIHHRAFRISDATAPEYSDPDGNATISFSAQSLESMPSSSAKVMISGMTNQTKRFNGEEWVYFKVPVTVPVDAEKTFSFTVTIKEEGCPSYTRTIERTIKHYNLQ